MDYNYLKNKGKLCAFIIRNTLGIKEHESIDIIKVLEDKNNFTLVFMPLGKDDDGFSNKYKEHFIIIVNSEKPKNRINFTIAHELYHLFYEYNEKDKFAPLQYSEKIADFFASYLLISDEALLFYLKNNNLFEKEKILTISDIVSLENYFNVSRQAITIRLYEIGKISKQQQENFCQNVLESVKENGGCVERYKGHMLSPKIIGEYNKLAKKLLLDGIISQGKYDEYMIDAFNFHEIFGGDFDGIIKG